MDFIKFSIFYAYLYSPKNWLHKQHNTTKIYIFLISLTCLPYMPMKYIFVFFIGSICIYIYTYTPVQFNRYFYNIVSIFIFFILINIQQKNQITSEVMLSRNYTHIYPQNNYIIHYAQEKNIFFNQPYYLSISLIRLLVINLIYLFLMKFLLMTTNYEKIIQTYLTFFYKCINKFIERLTFEVKVAIQFLKITLKQLEIVKTTYITRSIQSQRRILSSKKIFAYFLCIQQLIVNIYNNINYISSTLYSREVHSTNLHIIYRRE